MCHDEGIGGGIRLTGLYSTKIECYINRLVMWLLALLGCTGQALSQTAGSCGTVSLISAESYTRSGVQFWSSGGAGIAESGLPTASFSNPASLDANMVTLYAEAGKRFAADWVDDLEFDGQWIVPGFLAVSFPAGPLGVSLGYANQYDLHLTVPPIPITTPQAPEGTGGFFSAERNLRSSVFFGSLRYGITDGISVGLTAGRTWVSLSDRISNVSAQGNGYGFLLVAGGLAQITPEVSIGAALTTTSRVTVESSYLSPPVLEPRGADSLVYAQLPGTYAFIAAYPWIAEAGGYWKVSRNVECMASIEYQRWSRVDAGFDNLWQIHVGTAISVVPELSLRLGLFTQSDPNESNQSYLNQVFLTIGLEHHFSEHLTLSGSVLDSHLFSTSGLLPTFENSSKKFRQTYCAAAAMYSL